MNDDLEIAHWRSEWTAQETTRELRPPDIRLSAIKQQRHLRAAHVGELMAALFFLVFSAAVGWRHPALETFLWVAVVWASTGIATAFSIYNWQILWKANLNSVSEYALEYQKRCMATLRAVRFGYGFLAVQVTISTVWFTLDYFQHRLTGARFAWALASIVCVAVGFWLLFRRYRRIALEELKGLRLSQQTPEE